MMSKLRDWWFSLEQRYKVLLICGASGLLILILIAVLFFVFSGTPREKTVKRFYKAWQRGDTESMSKYVYNQNAIEEWEYGIYAAPKDLQLLIVGEKPFDGYMIDSPETSAKPWWHDKNLVTVSISDMDELTSELEITGEPEKISGYEVRTSLYKGITGDTLYFDLIYDSDSWKIVRSDSIPLLDWKRN